MELKIAELTHLRHICDAEKNVALKKWYCHRFKKNAVLFLRSTGSNV